MAGGKKGRGTSGKSKASNPFETVGNKRKRPVVLNHRVKGAVRDVGRSRAKGDERRKAGLLGELARERRENEFDDKRIGEGEPGLDEDDKMLLRFQRERAARSRGGARARRGAYALDDDGGFGDLTHGGVPLSEGAIRASETFFFDGDEAGPADRRAEQAAHFGDGAEDARARTKDFIGDMIDKTKQEREERKAWGQRLAADLEKMDEGFGDLAKLLDFRDKDKRELDEDDYEVELRSMAFEKRVQASNPSVSPEERARARLEDLRRLESLRTQRLEGRDVGPAKRRRVDDPWARDKSDPWYGMTKPEGYEEEEEAAEEPEAAAEEEASDVPYVFDALPQTAAELEALVDAHAARRGDVALVLERLVAGFTPRLARANLPSYERFCEAVVAAAVAAGDGLWRGDDAAGAVAAYASCLGSVLEDLDPAAAAALVERALLAPAVEAGGGAPSPGAVLALKALARYDAVLCSADDDAGRVAHLATLALAKALGAGGRGDAGAVAAGCLAAAACLEYAGLNARGRTAWVPELFAFVASAIQALAGDEPPLLPGAVAPQAAAAVVKAAAAWTPRDDAAAPPRVALRGAAAATDAAFCAALVGALASLAAEAVAFTVCDANRAAAPDLARPLRRGLKALRKTLKKRKAHAGLVQAVDDAAAALDAARRRALDHRAAEAAARAERAAAPDVAPTLEPRLERRLVVRKDAHLDKTPKAELKKLKKEMKKEHKGALRELRKDAAFLADEAARTTRAAKDAKTTDRQKNYAWLQTQAQRGWQ